MLQFLVRANFGMHLVPEDVLVSEKVDDLALINWHSLLVSILKCLLVESIAILHVVVRLLRLLSELHFESLAHNTVIK